MSRTLRRREPRRPTRGDPAGKPRGLRERHLSLPRGPAAVDHDETSGASADIRVSDLARPGPGRRALPSMAASGAVAGRRDPDHLLPGDALDFWRVEAIEPGHLLRLRRDETAWPGWNCQCANGRAYGLPAARLVPFTWPGRPPLLARVAVTACHRLWRHCSQHHPCSQNTRTLPLRVQIVLDSGHGCRGAPCAAAIARSAGLHGLRDVAGAGRGPLPLQVAPLAGSAW